MLLEEFFRAPVNRFDLVTAPYIHDEKDAWVIEVDMPGVQKENVDVSVLGRTLEVRGERRRGEKVVASYRERFQLPDHLRAPETIVAEMDAGVLRVKVQKSAAASRLQIAVT